MTDAAVAVVDLDLDMLGESISLDQRDLEVKGRLLIC